MGVSIVADETLISGISQCRLPEVRIHPNLETRLFSSYLVNHRILSIVLA